MGFFRAAAFDGGSAMLEIEYNDITGNVTGYKCINNTDKPVRMAVHQGEVDLVRVESPMVRGITEEVVVGSHYTGYDYSVQFGE